MPKIQLRLAAALAGFAVAISLLFGVLVERTLRARELTRIEHALDASAHLVAELVRGVPFTRASSAELSALATRAGSAAGARVTLIARDGTVVADSELRPEELANVANHASRAEVAQALAGGVGVATRRSETVGRPLLYLAVPHGDPDGGVVRVAADLGSVDAAIGGLRRALVAGAALSLVAALVLSLALSQALTRPLRAIHAALVQISGGDLGARVRWRSNDELGQVARAIDRMATDLEQSHGEISAERDRLETVLRVMVEGVLVVDDELRIVLANPRVRELFGTRAEPEGRRPLESIRSADVHDLLAEALASSAPVRRELAVGGAERRVLGVQAASFSIAGTKGAVAVFHDMTEVRRLETVRRDFVANASHEIKTPLTAIRGFAETLLGAALPERETRSYLQIILNHSERLSRLVEDLLELSRLESGSHKLAPSAFDVAALATQLCEELEPRIRERGFDVRVQGEDAPQALADPRAVEQILQNLLDNALKYSDSGKRIDVRVRGAGPSVRVDVADRGPGIPEADRARIFERFYRVDRGRSREQGGTGLGLAIVKHLVQASGGEIWVTSTPGEGSTFSFTLPAADPAS
ncbi:MAG TPA: ATP-binding protein [Myxococcota bacterium]|nr:ATP-binding protein [Myxococcota bacterium]